MTSSTGNKFVVGFPRNLSRAEAIQLVITNPESSAVSFTVTPINISGMNTNIMDVLASSLPSMILLVACDNGTVVKFHSSTITLNSMETYLIASDTDDLRGTKTTSSKPCLCLVDLVVLRFRTV